MSGAFASSSLIETDIGLTPDERVVSQNEPSSPLCPFPGRSLRYYKRRGKEGGYWLDRYGFDVDISASRQSHVWQKDCGDWAIIDCKTIYKLPVGGIGAEVSVAQSGARDRKRIKNGSIRQRELARRLEKDSC